MANVSLELVFGMFFLTWSGADIDFLDWELCWRTYLIQKVLLIIKHIKLVGKKEFTAIAVYLKHETFVAHIASLCSTLLNADVHLFCRSQIAGLIAEEASTNVFAEYTHFANVFFPNLVFKLFEYTEIYNQAMK